MRGALDRRVLAAVSSKVRHYCIAGRGRGRAAPSPSPAAAPAPQQSPSATGLGHGRGRIPGTTAAARPIGESASPDSAAPAAKPAVAIKGRGRGESPATAAPNAGKSSATTAEAAPSAKPAAASSNIKSSKKVAAAKKPLPVSHQSTETAAHGSQAAAPPPSQAAAAQPAQATRLEASEMFSALIQSCLARGLVHEIDYVYSAMQSAHVPANMQTCQTLIQVYIQLGSVQKMDGIYMEMREVRGGVQKPEPSAQEKAHASEMLGALINSWYSRGYFQEVDLAYRGLKLSHLSVPQQTYAAVLDSYNRLGNQGAVNLLYEEMRSAMAPPQTPAAAPPAAQPRATTHVQRVPVQPVPAQPGPAGAQPVSAVPGYGTPLSASTHPQHFAQAGSYPPQQPPVYQPAYPVQPPVQQWPSYYPPYVSMQPGVPNTVYYNPQTQTYQQAGYPGYQPGYHGYPPTYPPPGYPPTGYPPGYPGAAQYQTPQPVPYAPPPVPPRPVVHPPAQVQSKPGEQARPKLELQPKALELLQKTALLKQAQDRASALKGQIPAQQASAAAGGQYVAPQYGPPSVAPTAVPPVYPAVRPAFAPRPVGQPVPAPAPKPEAKVPQVDAKPAAVKVERPAQDVKPQVLKSETKPAAKVKPVPTSAAPKPQPVPDTKPAPVKPPVDVKPQAPETKPKAPADVKPKAAVKTAELSVETKETKLSTADAELPSPGKLKLGLKDKKEAAAQLESAAKTEEPPVNKLPSLKLNVPGRGKTAAEAPERPKSPSLQLGIKKQTEAPEKTEEPAAAPEAATEERPKSPSLRLGLKKTKPTAPAAAAAAEETESPRESDASETEAEALQALPSLRKKTARGRGKGGPTVDPLASIIGLHTPSDAFLQQDGLLSQEDANMPSLPFEPRRGQGRGKVIPVADAAAVAAEKQRLKLVREEQAARAIAILESALGKSQMSVYLERRKKRFSDQQFSLGDFSPRGATEGRAVSTRKAKDSKQKAVVGEIDVDGALEYIAPEDYMSKGDELSEVEEAVKGSLHQHFMLLVDPEAAMEEFGTNPDIDDKPLPTLEQTLELAKEELMAQDGIEEKEWEDAVEDVKRRAPQLESLAKRYSGPVKKNAKQNNKELHEIVAKLPPFVSPELTAFTKRAMLTLQNNPGWGARDKKLLLNRLVSNAQHAPTSSAT